MSRDTITTAERAPSRRRAALIATGITIPLVVVLLFAFIAVSGNDSKKKGPLPALSYSAGPQSQTEIADCAKVLSELPVALGKLDPRVVHTANTVAWGDPAIVLQCGVARPKTLVPGDSEELIPAGSEAGPWLSVSSTGGANVYTTVDRAVYIAVTIPGKYSGADYLPVFGTAIRKALPAVCIGPDDTNVPIGQLCSHRK